MTAPASVMVEIFELRSDIRPSLDAAVLRAIYRHLLSEALSAYVLKRSIFSSRLEQIDVHALDSESNFKLAMSGERLLIVPPAVSQVPAGLLHHYPQRSTDIPRRLGDLASNASSLLAKKIGVTANAYMFLHDLEAILFLRADSLPT